MNLAPLFFVASISISSFTSFFLSTQGMYINRTFLNMPLSLYEVNVKKKDNDYYFDKTKLKTDILNYLSYSLKNRVDSYEIGMKFYSYSNNEWIENNEDYLNGVKIRFKCVYYRSFNIDSSLSFYIKEGELNKNE